MNFLSKLRQWWQLQTGEEDALLDGDLAAWLISLIVHAGLLVLFTLLTLLLPPDQRLSLSATPVEVEPELIPEEFTFSEEAEDEVGALADAGTAASLPSAPTEAFEPEVEIATEPTALIGELPAMDFDEPILHSPNLSEDVVLKGEGTVSTTGAAGAIDRITNEIVLSLDQRETLVIWLFDRSGSLQRQRDEIIHRFERVYDELGVIEASGNPAFARHKDKPLLTAVASFGADVQLLTKEPTDEISAIKSAVEGVRNDPSGVENVFSSVGHVARQFRHYRLKSPRRNVMIVVFTDEAGNDVNRLDAALDRCRKYEMPVFVVGVPAPFGRQNAYVRYVDPNPKYDQRTQWVPIHQGPESLLPERLRLYFGNEGREDEMIDSGFGPFGLTRLAYETGGVYFAVHPNRAVGHRMRRKDTAVMSSYVSRFFDPAVMRAYRPDYVSVEQYRSLLAENRARAVLVQAANLSWTRPLKNPRTRFPKVDEAEFARDLSRAQRDAAELEPVIGRLVALLRQGESDRPRLVRPRWQAGFDLAIGRALAVKVRTEGYNTMLARAKQGMTFKKKKSDTWVLAAADEISSGSVLAKQARQAHEYLQRVINEHEGTPWALLAERELKTPLGWTWQERFTDVVRRRQQMAGADNRRNDDPPQPPDRPLRKPPAL